MHPHTSYAAEVADSMKSITTKHKLTDKIRPRDGKEHCHGRIRANTEEGESNILL